MASPRPLRSLLFVPGSRPEFFVKAAASGADALVFDLEDAVAPAMKAVARDQVAAQLAQRTQGLSFVRINHPERGELESDLAVLAPHAAQAVMAPKISGPDDLGELDERLALHERQAGLERDAIGVLVVIETCLGLRNLFETLRSFPRIGGAGLASAEQGDLMVELGGQWTPDGEALAYARGKFVCEARAARSPWLLDGAFMNLADEGALEKEARIGRVHGFTGKIAIHPRQVETLNRVFSPTDADVARARALLAAYQEAKAHGRGAVKVAGMMVDAANVRWAEQVLAGAGD
ncbi:MAG: Citrate lyase subunit beta / citryl-CoA lyase [Caulobacter sp.]|nr:Citrate lyase subunit beta / citryl-CoA lyase [Caulobacter sp.]